MYYLANTINILFGLINLAILIRVIISWVQPDPFNPVVRFIYQITEPILLPFRRLIPPTGGLDFSPLIAFFVLEFLRRFIMRMLF